MEFKDYRLHDEVSIGPYTFEVTINQGTNRYYLSGKNCIGEQIFKHLGVEKHAYVKNIVGQEYGGGFPETRTLEDLNKVIKQLQIDCLLKEAKEKYFVGVVFRSIFSKFDYTSSGKFEWVHSKQLIRDSEVYGVVWGQNEWAEIILEEPKQPEINTYGLKVGDIFKEDIISFWSARANNQYDPFSKKWYKNNTNFINSRQIKSFKVIDGIVGFLISGTHELYLRAEGFKEFAEGFNKSKSAFEFEVGKWYKCEGYNYAIKYLKKEVRNSKYAIVYSDIITYDDRYESFPEGSTGVGYVDEGTWYELTDLSEIQQYLPDDHPDKTSEQLEHIVGKWYKCKDYGYAIKYLRKETHDSRCAVVYSDFISNNKEYKSCPEGRIGVGYTDDAGWYELTDLSEIQQYLPDGHPDKIKAQPEYIVEKWYRLGAWIGKFRKLDGDRFCVFKSGTPSDNYKFPDGGHLSIKCQGTPVLITDMTEVYKLFPEEKPTDLELERWYEDGDFIVYLYARNSVYGFHHDYWFESNGFNEKGLKLCHPQKVDDKFSKYIRNEYKIGDIVTCPYDQQIFKIKELDFNIRKDRVIVSALDVKKSYGFLFYQGAWAKKMSDWKVSERELNLTVERYYPGTDIIMPDYDEWIKEDCLEQESTTELLLKSKNKQQKFVKLTEIKTITL